MEFIQKYTRVNEDCDQKFINEAGELITKEQVSDREFIDYVTKFDDQQLSNYFLKSLKEILRGSSRPKLIFFKAYFGEFEKRIQKFKDKHKIFKKKMQNVLLTTLYCTC